MASIHFDPPVLAHRGASAYAPENTMSAFLRAVQLGIKWVEFDVMLASCGTPIIFHDDTLDRTTNGHGDVANCSYAYLRTLDAGSWFSPLYAGERIPSLEEVAQFLVSTGLHANVEIKPLPGQDEQTVLGALNILSTFFPEDSPQILYSSFSIPSLQCLRQHAPSAQRALLMHDWNPEWRLIADELQCTSINVYQEELNVARAQEIKHDKRMLLSYTVNDPDRAEQLFSWGVDAVFSDMADQIARFG